MGAVEPRSSAADLGVQLPLLRAMPDGRRSDRFSGAPFYRMPSKALERCSRITLERGSIVAPSHFAGQNVRDTNHSVTVAGVVSTSV